MVAQTRKTKEKIYKNKSTKNITKKNQELSLWFPLRKNQEKI